MADGGFGGVEDAFVVFQDGLDVPATGVHGLQDHHPGGGVAAANNGGVHGDEGQEAPVRGQEGGGKG